MTCMIEGCGKPHKSFGLCGMHYMRKRRTGDANMVRPPGIAGDAKHHPLYVAWAGMVNRCHNPNNSSFKRYGAVGITVCDRWKLGNGHSTGFRCFLSDMGERPTGHTLDRIDAQGPYEKSNCRWATPAEQRRNLSKRGAEDATRKGSLAKRTREYTPLGNAIFSYCQANSMSINSLSDQFGYRYPSFLFAVCYGLKSPSPRLSAALKSISIDLPKVRQTFQHFAKMKKAPEI